MRFVIDWQNGQDAEHTKRRNSYDCTREVQNVRYRCNRTRQRPGPDNDHTIWSFSGPEILGPHNDVGKIVRSLSGPETPVFWLNLTRQVSRILKVFCLLWGKSGLKLCGKQIWVKVKVVPLLCMKNLVFVVQDPG